MGIRKRQKNGFTIVELAVIISVIGILAGISIVGYGAWQKRTAENVIKTDLANAAAALENARNFGNTYPLVIPSTFKPSDKVVIAGGAADINGVKGYCIQASSSQDTSVATMYVTSVSMTPQNGNCAAWSSLVGWWPMNGNANDASGNNRNGTVYGATLTNGKNGQTNGAYSFSGSYIETPTISIPSAVTTSAWVYSTNFNQYGFVIGKNPVNDQWEIFFEGSVLRWRGGAPYQNTTYCPVPSNNAWHHIVGSQTGTTAALYIDGVQCGSDTAANPIGNGSGTVDIGRFNNAYYYNGTIDDVRVYNQALTASDVLALYKSGPQ